MSEFLSALGAVIVAAVGIVLIVGFAMGFWSALAICGAITGRPVRMRVRGNDRTDGNWPPAGAAD